MKLKAYNKGGMGYMDLCLQEFGDMPFGRKLQKHGPYTLLVPFI